MKDIIKKSKVLNKTIFYLGQVFFKIFGKTPKVAYMAMINLYCLTNGRFLEKTGQKNEFSYFFKSKSKLFKKITPENIYEKCMYTAFGSKYTTGER